MNFKLIALALFLFSSNTILSVHAEISATIKVKVFLQGAIQENGTMKTTLNEKGLLSKEFNNQNLPTNVVDKIDIELRNFANPSTIAATQKAWLLSDGSILDFETAKVPAITFPNIPAGKYFIAVKHRNHLPLMSGLPIAIGTNPNNISIDFSDIKNLYSKSRFLKLSEKATMISGDVGDVSNPPSNPRYSIDAIDNFYVSKDAKAKLQGYINTDLNLDGIVNEADVKLVQSSSDHLYNFTFPKQ